MAALQDRSVHVYSFTNDNRIRKQCELRKTFPKINRYPVKLQTRMTIDQKHQVESSLHAWAGFTRLRIRYRRLRTLSSDRFLRSGWEAIYNELLMAKESSSRCQEPVALITDVSSKSTRISYPSALFTTADSAATSEHLFSKESLMTPQSTEVGSQSNQISEAGCSFNEARPRRGTLHSIRLAMRISVIFNAWISSVCKRKWIQHILRRMVARRCSVIFRGWKNWVDVFKHAYQSHKLRCSCCSRAQLQRVRVAWSSGRLLDGEMSVLELNSGIIEPLLSPRSISNPC